MTNEVFRKGIEIDYNNSNLFLNAMYKTAAGRFLLQPFTAVSVSKLARLFLNSRLSLPLVDRYIKKYDIDLTYCEKKSFSSFNDFFTRKLKREARPFSDEDNKLCSPCDSKLTVYKIDEDSVFDIKDVSYTVAELLRSNKLAEKYKNGWCFIYRLEPNNYHRYAYIDNGVKTKNFYIGGMLHTVQPIAINRVKVFRQNCREFSLLRTENFGDVIQIEVGALFVGKISNHHEKAKFKRGMEKGMFEFGGSTIIQLFEEGKVSPDSDILMNTIDEKETPIVMGEVIGYKL